MFVVMVSHNHKHVRVRNKDAARNVTLDLNANPLPHLDDVLDGVRRHSLENI